MHSQQESRDFSPTISRNWILPTTWMALEEHLDPQMRTHLGQHLDISCVGPWAENPVEPCLNFGPTERWDNKCMLFSAAKCIMQLLFSSRKLTCPVGAAQLVGPLTHTPRVCRFDFRAEHIPRLQLGPCWGAHGRQPIDTFPCSLPLSLKSVSISLSED